MNKDYDFRTCVTEGNLFEVEKWGHAILWS